MIVCMVVSVCLNVVCIELLCSWYVMKIVLVRLLMLIGWCGNVYSGCWLIYVLVLVMVSMLKWLVGLLWLCRCLMRMICGLWWISVWYVLMVLVMVLMCWLVSFCSLVWFGDMLFVSVGIFCMMNFLILGLGWMLFVWFIVGL